jgi:hypothetical protein
MAVDTRVLLAGLKDYKSSLERHLVSLNSEYQQLENRWIAFNREAEGDYADQFRGGWLKTQFQFKEYILRSQLIKAMLEERINFLEEVNRQEGGL